MNQDQLTEVFRSLGARDPESWARSQIEEGIPQLARFVFLREAWRHILSSGISTIPNSEEDAVNKNRTGFFDLVRRMVGVGVSQGDLVDFMRIIQRNTLFDICYLIGGIDSDEGASHGVDWALFQVDANGRPIVRIDGLHESVLETAPSDIEFVDIDFKSRQY